VKIEAIVSGASAKLSPESNRPIGQAINQTTVSGTKCEAAKPGNLRLIIPSGRQRFWPQ